jgi:hypothetical protein
MRIVVDIAFYVDGDYAENESTRGSPSISLSRSLCLDYTDVISYLGPWGYAS